MMTKQFNCTPRQAAAGVRYFLELLKPRPPEPVMSWSGGSGATARPR
jgi:hypothetical protein